MNCKKARKLILELIYDELSSESVSELQDHITGCEDCLRYKTELQRALKCLDRIEDLQEPEHLVTAAYDAISREYRRSLRSRRFRLPVWATAFGVCVVIFSVFTLLVSEIRYEDSTLIVRFGEQKSEQKTDLASENTAKMLAAYREEQLRYKKQLSDELRAFVADELRASVAKLSQAVYEHEVQRDKRVASAFQLLQIQQDQKLSTIQKDLDTLTSLTENEFLKTYTAMERLASYQ